MTYEVCVERQTNDVDGEDEHHDIDLDIFQCHPQATVCAQVFRVNIGNAHIFEALVTRRAAHRRLIDELLDFFGGSSQPVVAHLIESGSLTLEDVKEAEQTLRKIRAEKTKARGGR